MKMLKPAEQGFITMIVMIVVLLVAVIAFAYLRVLRAN
jgi:hypothetical protein